MEGKAARDSTFFGQDTPSSWAEWLDAFEREMLPVFSARGYGRDAAMIATHLQRLSNILEAEGEEELEPWQLDPESEE